MVSRLMIKVRLPQRMVYWFIGKRHLSLAKILFYLIAISAFLSFFIPNAITVLTLLPLLELLRRSYEKANGPSGSVATMLALATIYGANIGGMGSITATPANGILVTYAVLNDVPGIQHLTFASWLVWGIPLVIIFVCIAALILCMVLRPWKSQKNSIQLPFDAEKTYHPFQNLTIWIAVFYFLSSFILSLLMMYFSDRTLLILFISGILTLLFILFLFFLPVRVDPEADSGQVLLTLADCYNELPTRGFIFVGIAVVLAAILYAFKIHEFLCRLGRIDYSDRHIRVCIVFFDCAGDLLFNRGTQQYRRSAQLFCDSPSFGTNLGIFRSGNADHYHAFLHQCLYEPHRNRCKRFGFWRCQRGLVFKNACRRIYHEHCRSLVDFKLGFVCCGSIVWSDALVLNLLKS